MWYLHLHTSKHISVHTYSCVITLNHYIGVNTKIKYHLVLSLYTMYMYILVHNCTYLYIILCTYILLCTPHTRSPSTGECSKNHLIVLSSITAVCHCRAYHSTHQHLTHHLYPSKTHHYLPHLFSQKAHY